MDPNLVPQAPVPSAQEEFDLELPRWQRDTRHLITFGGARSGADDGAQLRYNWNEARLYNGLPRRRMTAGGRPIQAPVPAARYERAIDNQGNLVPVVVCSNRVDEKDPRNYADHILKLKRGPDDAPDSEFLFIDLPPYGIPAAAWYERCRTLREARHVLHAEDEQTRGEIFDTVQKRMENVTRDTLVTAVKDLVSAMFAEMKAQQAAAAAPAPPPPAPPSGKERGK